MNRGIHLPGEQRSFDFRREQSFSTSIEVDNFSVIPACHDDFSLDCDARMRGSNCLRNQKSLCARKLAAPCSEGNLLNHRGNVTRDTLQGKLSASLELRSAERIFAEGGMLGRLREAIQSS